MVASGPRNIAILVGLGLALAALEWHRCVAGGADRWGESALTAATVAVSEAVYLYSGVWAAIGVLVAGTVAAFLLALKLDKHPLWHAAGTPYLAIPALCLLALCKMPQHGVVTVSGMLIIVWLTDTGALIFGNLIGGPRIAPKLSPAKTWAGTIGGSILGALAFTFYVTVLPGAPALTALLFGFAFSFVAHAGDLLESFFKRRFGVKNSGSVIPGHGGVLDRIDSTLAATPAMALIVFVMHFNPVYWMHA
jgi:phosphatidate cytidylyltransferase